MKTLKKSILLSLVAPLLFSLLSFTNASIGNVITIRVYECVNTCSPRIVVSTKEKSQQIGLEKYKADSAMDRNAEIISNTLEQYLKEGYKVETSNIAEFGGALITTYILTK